MTAAQQQNEELVEQGYQRDNIKIYPILLGVSVTIYAAHTTGTLEQLGVQRDAALSRAQKLHTLMVQQLHSALTALLAPQTSAATLDALAALLDVVDAFVVALNPKSATPSMRISLVGCTTNAALVAAAEQLNEHLLVVWAAARAAPSPTSVTLVAAAAARADVPPAPTVQPRGAAGGAAAVDAAEAARRAVVARWKAMPEVLVAMHRLIFDTALSLHAGKPGSLLRIMSLATKDGAPAGSAEQPMHHPQHAVYSEQMASSIDPLLTSAQPQVVAFGMLLMHKLGDVAMHTSLLTNRREAYRMWEHELESSRELFDAWRELWRGEHALVAAVPEPATERQLVGMFVQRAVHALVKEFLEPGTSGDWYQPLY
ncbi:hypothetical protein FOA52_009170 [Chlamydomonas sp. UWO 241]|nr:hypothetical protein FOA52_009170 [Chlamydomonas sp. UWO 241]